MPNEDLHIRIPNGWIGHNTEFPRCSCGWEGIADFNVAGFTAPSMNDQFAEHLKHLKHLEASKTFLREEVYGGPHGD